MKKKCLFIICLILISTYGFATRTLGLQINGCVKGLIDGERIQLSLLTGSYNQSSQIFSSAIVKDNSFHLDGIVYDGPRLFYLTFAKHAGLFAVLCMDNERVILRGDIRNLSGGNITDLLDIHGSKSNLQYANIKYLDFAYSNLGVNGEANSFYKKLQDSLGNNAPQTATAKKTLDFFAKSLTQFTMDHPENHAIPILLYDIRAIYSGEPFFNDLYQHLDNKSKKSFYGRQLYESMSKFNGNALMFKAKNLNNLPFNLKIVVDSSKYVLIDFWASYCIPCRAENANLIDQYSIYHKMGLEIVGFSLDEDIAQWRNAVQLDKLPWTQVSDLSGTKSDVVKWYGANMIPKNVLIDHNGKIVAWDLFGENLRQQLKKLLRTEQDKN